MIIKPFKTGLIVGRFQVFHLGHEDMVRRALELCESVTLFIGSAQESNTNKNPLTFEERKEMIRLIFPDENQLKIYPLHDIGVGDNLIWGDYVLANFRIYNNGKDPDLVVSGIESVRNSWFDPKNAPDTAVLFLPKILKISGTEIRNMIRSGDENWKFNINQLLLHYKPILKLEGEYNE